MKAYSKDLRLKVLAAVDRGMPREEIVRVFGVSAPAIRRYLRPRRETGVVVHYSAISGSSFRSLDEGAKVSYEATRGRKGMQAENVQPV